MNQKIKIIILVAVLAAAAGGLAIIKKSAKPKAPAQSSQQTSAPKLNPEDFSLKTLSVGQIPAQLLALPKFPWEEGAVVLNSFEVLNKPTGRLQSTRSWVTKKTLKQNYDLYKKYLKDNGWTLAADEIKGDYFSLISNKGQDRLDITMQNNSTSKQNELSVMLLSNP